MFEISLPFYELCAIWLCYYRSEDNLYGKHNYFKYVCSEINRQIIVLNLSYLISNLISEMS